MTSITTILKATLTETQTETERLAIRFPNGMASCWVVSHDVGLQVLDMFKTGEASAKDYSRALRMLGAPIRRNMDSHNIKDRQEFVINLETGRFKYFGPA